MTDLRYAFRQLLKNPGFTAVAVLSLAFGIGVNTMMFSFFNGYLLRPVPVVKEPDRIVEMERTAISGGRWAFSLSEYEGFRDQNGVLSGLIADSGPHGGTLNLGGGSAQPDKSTAIIQGEEIRAKLVSGNYFSLLGIDAVLGRTFLPEEARTPGSHPVVVLSHAL